MLYLVRVPCISGLPETQVGLQFELELVVNKMKLIIGSTAAL